jgi:cellulose biosynthesis protein BcsQ
MLKYAFWNNKGGTGKTSLAFQVICRYANMHPDAKVLAIDCCPQANLSELFLGGLTNHGSQNLLQRQGAITRCTVGGYFQMRLPAPYSHPTVVAQHFITKPRTYNTSIPPNIDLVCGDPLLELQANAINTLANTQIPGTDTWISIINWLQDFLEPIEPEYTIAFIDANPSFAIYTQIALSTIDRLILPVMADDSSRRAIQNAFSLVYGLKLPSPVYSTYAFATKLHGAKRSLPRVHLIVKNRLTQYMGPASAYAAVLKSIDQDVVTLLASNPEMFTFADPENGLVDVRDFQTTGVVAFAKGVPFFSLSPGRLDIGGQRVRINEDYIRLCIKSIDDIVERL